MSEEPEGQPRLAAVMLHPSAGAASGNERGPWPRRARWPAVLGLGALFGLLFGLHVRDAGVPALAWISTVPWALICVHPRLRGRMGLLGLALGLQLLALVGLEFLRGHGVATWLLAPLMYWPLFLLSLPACRLILRRWPTFPTALLWPLVFTGVEWLRIRISPGELSLCHLAYSQVRLTKMIQVCDLAGAGLVSFQLTAFAGLVTAVLVSPSLLPTWRARWRWLRWQVAGVAALIALVFAYGWQRDTERFFHDGPTLQILQTDTPRSREAGEIRRVFEYQTLQTLSTMRPGEVDAILWPENSLMTPLRQREGWNADYLDDLRRLVARTEAPLFFDSGWIDEQGESYHAAYLLDREGGLQHHLKARLLPWTEFVPLRGFARLFGEAAERRWLSVVEGFVGFLPEGRSAPLSQVHPMTLEGRDGRSFTFGAPICFEIATPRVVNCWTREGVDFLVNPASEGRLGDGVHLQTVAISGFRAIESRVPVVRVTNDGISCVIDSNGRPRDVLAGRSTGSPINEAGVLFATLPLDSRGSTLYSRFGDWFPIACLLVTLALCAMGLVPRRPPAT